MYIDEEEINEDTKAAMVELEASGGKSFAAIQEMFNDALKEKQDETI